MIDLSPRSLPATEPGRIKFEIRPTEFRSARLIAELADGWISYEQRVSIRQNTRANYLNTIRNIGRFLDLESDSKLTLQNADSGTLTRLGEWRKYLNTRFPYPSATPQMFESRIKVLCKAYHLATNASDPIVLKWADSKVRQSYGAVHRKQLDEFSHREFKELTNAARKVVRAYESMLAVGQRLLSINCPAKGTTADLLQTLHANPYFRLGSRTGRKPAKVWKTINQLGLDAEELKKYVTHNPFYSLLVPHQDYYNAIRVLIHANLDWPPETTFYLQQQDVQFEDNRVEIRWKKARAHKSELIALPILHNGHGWSPGDLFLRAHRAMKFSHRFAGPSSTFWLSSRTAAVPNPNGEPEWIKLSIPSSNASSISTIIDLANLMVSEPHSLIRLRKTSKSIRAIKMGDINDAAGRDHTSTTFANFYLGSTTVKVLAAKTMSATQDFVLDKISPTVIPSYSSEILQDQHTNQVQAIASEIANESPTDTKLSIAACQAPLDSPFTSQGELCTKPAEFCLQCRNAIFLRDHGPRLQYLYEILREQKRELTPPQFADKFGQAWTNINAVLKALDLEAPSPAVKTSNPALDLPITNF